MKHGEPTQDAFTEGVRAVVPDAGTEPTRSPVEKDDLQVVLGGAQLLLSEKRTALSLMRAGIGVFALPLGVLSLLVASSKYYDAREVLPLFLPLLALCLALVVLGAYLVLRSMARMRHYDHVLNELKRHHPVIGQYIE